MCEKYCKIHVFETLLYKHNFVISYLKHIFRVEKAISACKVLLEGALEGQIVSQRAPLGLPLASKHDQESTKVCNEFLVLSQRPSRGSTP